jgi:hypothetical protein
MGIVEAQKADVNHLGLMMAGSTTAARTDTQAAPEGL